jgi:hypothetical protein
MIVARAGRELAPEDWSSIEEALARTEFWVTPSYGRISGPDGARWILEGRSGALYHVVDRHSPGSGAFRDACLLFLKLGGIQVPEETLY